VDHTQYFIFLTDYGGAWIQLLQVVSDRILDVDVSFREHVHAAATFHQLSEVG
jgi:hypothetical protein